MNILFLIGKYPSIGGVETIMSEMSNSFVEEGNSVSIVSFQKDDVEFERLNLSAKVNLYCLSLPVRSKANINQLKSIIDDNKIDVIISQWAVPWYVAYVIKKANKDRKAKYFTVHHNVPNTNAVIEGIKIKIEKRQGFMPLNKVLLWGVRSFSRLSLRYVYNASDKYILLSDSFKPLLARYIGKKEVDKAVAIPNFISDEPYDNYAEKSDEIVCVGRIEYNQKRTFRILEIWEEIYKKFPSWKLTFVGDGPDRDNLQQLIDEKGLKNVTITGFTNPRPYYKRAKIFLQTSEYEGFPMTILEAMRFGVVPFVLGSFPAVFDLIDNDINGIVVDYPFNKSIFVEKLTILMNQYDGMEQKSKEAILKSDTFSKPNVLQLWSDLI